MVWDENLQSQEKQALQFPRLPWAVGYVCCVQETQLVLSLDVIPLHLEGSGGFMLLSSTHTSHLSCCLPDSGLRSAWLTPR